MCDGVNDHLSPSHRVMIGGLFVHVQNVFNVT